MPNKRTRQTPRKSSTNTAALSTAIKNIQKEINPYIRLSGGMASGTSKTTYIDRSCVGEFTMASKTLSVESEMLVNIIPDGAKILSMKLSNTNGRKLTVTIPKASPLVEHQGDLVPTFDLMRKAFAPITRFPTIKVEIPDLVARNIDTTATSVVSPIFTLVTDGATDIVIVKFHYKMAI